MRYKTSFILFVGFALVGVAQGQSNIDPTNKFGWGENVGWTNWRDADSSVAGVVVSGTFMGGFIWGENVGFVNVGDAAPANGIAYANIDGTDSGVNIDANGDLHGLAWGENVGWFNFDGGAMAAPPLGVMPPASRSATFASRIASSSDVLP